MATTLASITQLLWTTWNHMDEYSGTMDIWTLAMVELTTLESGLTGSDSTDQVGNGLTGNDGGA